VGFIIAGGKRNDLAACAKKRKNRRIVLGTTNQSMVLAVGRM
jgi:hypothetical protein